MTELIIYNYDIRVKTVSGIKRIIEKLSIINARKVV